MHNEFAVDEVKRVTSGGKRFGNHLSHRLGIQFGKVVDMLASVLAVRNAKSEVEVEGLEVAISEKVSLDHPEVLDRFVANGEFDGGADCAELQKCGRELIPDEAAHVRVVRVNLLNNYLLNINYYFLL